MRNPRIAILACVLGLLACSDDTTYENVGSVCISGDADAAHSVEVDFQVCLSSSCDEVVESTCDVSVSGSDITVTASATVKSKGGACTADCGQLTVDCETDPLAAGNYNVVYGDVQGTLTVPPITDEPTCFGGE